MDDTPSSPPVSVSEICEGGFEDRSSLLRTYGISRSCARYVEDRATPDDVHERRMTLIESLED